MSYVPWTCPNLSRSQQASAKGRRAGKSSKGELRKARPFPDPRPGVGPLPPPQPQSPSVRWGLGDTAGLPLSFPLEGPVSRPWLVRPGSAICLGLGLAPSSIWGTYPSHSGCRSRILWPLSLEEGLESADKLRALNPFPGGPGRQVTWGLGQTLQLWGRGEPGWRH